MTISFVFSLIAALCWVGLLLLPWRPWSTRERLEPDAFEVAENLPADLSAQLTVLIPARDEAEGIQRTLRAIRQQSPEVEILVIDDESSDATASLARQAGAKVINGQPPPPGWTGKLWALEQGRQFAERKWILQIDADIELAPGMLAALMRQQQQLPGQGYDLVSIMALLPVTGFWQRLLLPAYVWFFKLIYPFALANGPTRWLAAAAGGCILVRRTLVEKIGGYGSLRHAVIDDCTLAAYCKKAGGRTWLGLSRSVYSHRASASLGELADLVARTAYTQLRHSVWMLILVTALLFLSFWVPPLVLVLPGIPPSARALAALAWLALVLAYWPLQRFYRLSPAWALLLPITASLYLWMTWLSAWRHWRGRGALWKGRQYLDQQMK